MTKARTNADNASADIQGVTAGDGITGGGSSGVVTVAVSSDVLRTTGGQVISANTSATALEIRQIGAGNAFLVEDDTNPDATPFVVSPSGQVFVGKTTAHSLANYNRAIQIEGNSAATVGLSAIRNSNDQSAPAIEFAKTKGTTNGSVTTVAVGDNLGLLSFGGADGTSLLAGAAQINVSVDNTVSTGIIPTRISFNTTPVTGGLSERMRIDGNGRITGVNSAVLDIALVTNAQTASYTLVAADGGKLVEISNASANTVTIPTNASVPYAIGTQINILQTGAGQTTISGTSGVTVNSTGATGSAPKLRAQWSSATAIKRATDTWVVVGDIA